MRRNGRLKLLVASSVLGLGSAVVACAGDRLPSSEESRAPIVTGGVVVFTDAAKTRICSAVKVAPRRYLTSASCLTTFDAAGANPRVDPAFARGATIRIATGSSGRVDDDAAFGVRHVNTVVISGGYVNNIDPESDGAYSSDIHATRPHNNDLAVLTVDELVTAEPTLPISLVSLPANASVTAASTGLVQPDGAPDLDKFTGASLVPLSAPHTILGDAFFSSQDLEDPEVTNSVGFLTPFASEGLLSMSTASLPNWWNPLAGSVDPAFRSQRGGALLYGTRVVGIKQTSVPAYFTTGVGGPTTEDTAYHLVSVHARLDRQATWLADSVCPPWENKRFDEGTGGCACLGGRQYRATDDACISPCDPPESQCPQPPPQGENCGAIQACFAFGPLGAFCAGGRGHLWVFDGTRECICDCSEL